MESAKPMFQSRNRESSNFNFTGYDFQRYRFNWFQSRNRESSNFNCVATCKHRGCQRQFQSRNRESSNFNQRTHCILLLKPPFQSRNRESSNFNGAFNPAPQGALEWFQSRNRESSNFNVIDANVKFALSSFNLVIENLLISTPPRQVLTGYLYLYNVSIS